MEYVQGYRLDAKGHGTYTVTTDMAHAWPEVYFEGKGWIAFESTPLCFIPVYASFLRQAFHVPDQEEQRCDKGQNKGHGLSLLYA